MRQTPGRALSPARQASALVSAQVRGRGEDRAYRMYTGGEFDGDVWVRSGKVTPLSCEILAGVVSAPARSIGLISWGWVKSAMGVENSSSSVLTSLCIYTISSMIVLISGLFSNLAGAFLRYYT